MTVDKQKVYDTFIDLEAELNYIDKQLEKALISEDEDVYARWVRSKEWFKGEIMEMRKHLGIVEDPGEWFKKKAEESMRSKR